MKGILLSFLVVCIYASEVQSLSCVECGKATCTTVSNCTGGMVKDACGCCDVCAKQEGETCGGLSWILGKCDENLRCFKHSIDNDSEGICKVYNETCEWPKTLVGCGSACPPTCENPNPEVCIAVCRLDACVCSEGLVEYNGTCVLPSDCPTFSPTNCTTDCSSLDLSKTSCEYSKAWVCELRNWRCHTHEWKIAAEEWWEESGCSDPEFQNRWDELYACDATMTVVKCANASKLKCIEDEFGCPLCHCADGQYTDGKQLMAIWKNHLEKYQRSKELYREAKEICWSSEPTC